MELFGSSGTRGIANVDLTPEFALRVGKATATVLDADRVAIARDTRTTGPMLANAAASGLMSVGATVDRFGILPTPALQAYATRESVPAIAITASHNPPEYNGLKLVAASGADLDVDAIERVESALLESSFRRADWDETGDEQRIDGEPKRYRDSVRSAVDREHLADQELTVAIDPGHGAGSITSPTLFRELGCRVHTVNADPDGRFPRRDPEPVEENLGDLRRLVRTTDADLGIAHDGDADRAIFVDERGEHVEGDAALAALAAAELSAGDVVVSAANVSQRLVDVADEVDAELDLTAIGSTWIVQRVRERMADGDRVAIAGEGNGGVIYPAYRLCRDGAYTATRFLELLSDAPASDVVDAYDGYHTVRTSLAYDSAAEKEMMLDAVADRAEAESGRAEVTTIDGYRFDYGDGWVLARPSGTEPVIRVYAEARDPARADALLGSMERQVRSAAD